MKLLTALASATVLTLAVLPAAAQAPSTLRIGLQEDPDVLDPHKARTFVGRIVFTGALRQAARHHAGPEDRAAARDRMVVLATTA